MAWTTPETAVAGQVLTAAYLNTNLVANTIALPRGYINQTTLATTFTTTSTSYVDVTGLSVTFTAEANRRYHVQLHFVIHSSGAVPQIVINDGTNNIAEGYGLASGVVVTSTVSAITTPASGSVTYKARFQTGSGTGTVYGTSTRASLISRLLVEDIGSTV